jgi:hypothetical protein
MPKCYFLCLFCLWRRIIGCTARAWMEIQLIQSIILFLILILLPVLSVQDGGCDIRLVKKNAGHTPLFCHLHIFGRAMAFGFAG